jgi:hypothetical protein
VVAYTAELNGADLAPDVRVAGGQRPLAARTFSSYGAPRSLRSLTARAPAPREGLSLSTSPRARAWRRHNGDHFCGPGYGGQCAPEGSLPFRGRSGATSSSLRTGPLSIPPTLLPACTPGFAGRGMQPVPSRHLTLTPSAFDERDCRRRFQPLRCFRTITPLRRQALHAQHAMLPTRRRWADRFGRRCPPGTTPSRRAAGCACPRST